MLGYLALGFFGGGLAGLAFETLRSPSGPAGGSPPQKDAARPSESGPAKDSPAEKPSNAELHKWARPVLAEAFKAVVGREPTLPELQYAHAVAWLESSYGRGWKGAMKDANNWGAVQCAKGSTADCVEYEDSYADGTKYKVSFRRYATPVDGAKDVIRHVFEKRPRTAEALASDGATVSRASFAMRREKYYEGFCPQATKTHGNGAVRPSLAHPDQNEATRDCAREATTAHAKRAADIIRNVAAACGDPFALGAGSFEDADAWYRATFPDAGPAVSGTVTVEQPWPPPALSSDSKAGGLLLAAVRAGAEEPPAFVEVLWEGKGKTAGLKLTLRVATRALRAQVIVDGKKRLLRLPVSYRETVEICRLKRLVPPTESMVDAIWSAGKHIRPANLGKWPAKGDTSPEAKALAAASSRAMMRMGWVVQFNDAVDRQLGEGSKEHCFEGKAWILHPRITDVVAVNYGLFRQDGTPFQAPGGKHDWNHYDYSQLLNPVDRIARDESGAEVDIIEVLRKVGMPEHILAPFGELPARQQPSAEPSRSAPAPAEPTLTTTGADTFDAKVYVTGSRRDVGQFDTLEQAVEAAKRAALRAAQRQKAAGRPTLDIENQKDAYAMGEVLANNDEHEGVWTGFWLADELTPGGWRLHEYASTGETK